MATRKKKLITVPQATTAMQWLHHMSTDATDAHDREQAMVVRGLILGLQRVADILDGEIATLREAAENADAEHIDF